MKFNNVEKINVKDYELIVIGVCKDGKFTFKDKNVEKAFEYVNKNGAFKLESGQIKSVPYICENIIYTFIYLDKKDTNNVNKLMSLFEKLYKSIENEKAQKVAITLSEMISVKMLGLLVQSFVMSEYRFNKYKNAKQEKSELVVDICGLKALDIKINENIGKGANITKDLVNEPANVLTPEGLANSTIEIMKGTDVKVEVFGKEDIEKLNMKAFLSVAQGSKNPARLIVMTYMGNADCKKITGLVGKGVTYDSGGFSLKANKVMVNMKNDMGGSAAVIGAMKILAENKVKANVIAVVPACENILSIDAYKPGDVIGSMSGKTIEVKNADAEGRLILADAVTYIINGKKVDRVIDIATLTGAGAIIFGQRMSPYLCTDEDIYKALEKASEDCGDRIWRMPIIEEVNEMLDSEIADLKNTGGEGAPGMIVAGMFIGKFREGIPWAHIDMAGKAMINNKATGYGSRLLAQMVENL